MADTMTTYQSGIREGAEISLRAAFDKWCWLRPLISGVGVDADEKVVDLAMRQFSKMEAKIAAFAPRTPAEWAMKTIVADDMGEGGCGGTVWVALVADARALLGMGV